MDRRTMEIAGAVAGVGGALVGLRGVTSKKWHIAQATLAVVGAIAVVAVRFSDDSHRLTNQRARNAE